jgi:tripartite-type tricarboxylate transporter receptor subunit TctC
MWRAVNKFARVEPIRAKMAPNRMMSRNGSAGMIATMREANRFVRGFAGSLLALSALASPAHAVEGPWPERAVHIIVAQAPSGPPDLIARFIAGPLGRALAIPVVVDNRPGAAGIIGVTAAAQAAPDGYTLLIGTLSTYALVPHASATVPFDVLRDFAAVANLFRSIKVLWINPALPPTTTEAWIAYVKARPGALNFASGGIGSSNHIDMELLKSTAGLDIVHVPCNGPTAAIAAVGSGDAQAMIVSVGTGLPLAQGGRIRPLVVFSERRALQFPNVPTARELGLAVDNLDSWIGLLAPAGTPEAIVVRVNAELNKILRLPDAAAWAERQGMEIVGGTPASFAATMAADYQRAGEMIRRLRLQKD